MNKTLKSTLICAAAGLILAGCTSFENRKTASSSFEYKDAKLIEPYKLTKGSTNDESRDTFEIPKLTKEQLNSGSLGQKVDIRPPTQFRAVIDGVTIDESLNATGVIFSAFKSKDVIVQKVWKLLNSYLNDNKIERKSSDDQNFEIVTKEIKSSLSFGFIFMKDIVNKKISYKFKVSDKLDSHSALLSVDVLDFNESTIDQQEEIKLDKKLKRDLEIAFINDLLEYASKTEFMK